MIEKLKALAWYYQLALVVAVAAGIFAGAWYGFISGAREEVASLNDQVTQLQAKNQAAQIATQRINEFRSLYASKMSEYDELKVLLPEEREITNVLQGLQDTARDSRLIVMRFSPREDTQQDFILAKPVEIEVDSNFNNLRGFFDKMAKLQRIVSITDFKLNQLDKQTADKTLHASFLLSAYYATPENLTTTAAPTNGAPNGQNNAQPAAQNNGQPAAPQGQPAPAVK